MFNDFLYKSVEELILPFFEGTEIELVEFRLRRQNQTLIVDVLADKPKGGITIDEVTGLNVAISRRLEETNVLQGSYVVEVASPGLDRPLKTAKDFKRVMEKSVRFYLSEKIHDKLEHTGNIKEVKDQSVLIQTKLEMMEIPLDKINKAVLMLE